MMTDLWLRTTPRAMAGPPLSSRPRQLHRQLPGYAITPLVSAPALAEACGIASLHLKLEDCRLGLPAFKILGASWAVVAELERRGALTPGWATLAAARDQVAPRRLTLVAATDGNHGRAVARMARALGCAAHIVVPAAMVPARRDALADEGAVVQVVDGSYDDAVALAAALANEHHIVIADTAWEGYDRVPADVIEGYGTIGAELDEQGIAPDLLLLQIGVGALATALVRHAARWPACTIVGVEPRNAACALASLRADQPVVVPGPHHTVMAGLACGELSPLAWPVLRARLDATLAIDDAAIAPALRGLAAAGISAGETGAAGVAGLLALSADQRDALGIGRQTRALAIISEGATDPVTFAALTGLQPVPCAAARRCPLCHDGRQRGW
jgi:diaminopropionate ammonia-lyase